ncbi:hypothetical protein ABBQ38_007509 [Trebouxia sp. C0009 RCD-2024]
MSPYSVQRLFNLCGYLVISSISHAGVRCTAARGAASLTHASTDLPANRLTHEGRYYVFHLALAWIQEAGRQVGRGLDDSITDNIPDNIPDNTPDNIPDKDCKDQAA